MAILNANEFYEAVHNFVGDRSDDDAIKFTENMLDTYNKAIDRSDQVDWEKKYHENDAAWRKKYMSRFRSAAVVTVVDEENPEVKDEITIDDLFE